MQLGGDTGHGEVCSQEGTPCVEGVPLGEDTICEECAVGRSHSVWKVEQSGGDTVCGGVYQKKLQG